MSRKEKKESKSKGQHLAEEMRRKCNGMSAKDREKNFEEAMARVYSRGKWAADHAHCR